MSSLLFSEGKTVWSVDGLSLPEFMRQNDIRDCNFLKMDVEGGEYAILPANAALLKDWSPTIHLSLHPCLLGPVGTPGIVSKLRRVTARFLGALRLIRSLGSYRHFYDCRGKEVGSRRLLRLCLRDVTLAIVATNVEWT
jgi:hypothetical protein